jgi:hypothetical protein
MIQLKLRPESMVSMFFDDIKGGKAMFTEDGIATVSQDEFEDFLKANNLIMYHNILKTYEDGEVHGEFTQE